MHSLHLAKFYSPITRKFTNYLRVVHSHSNHYRMQECSTTTTTNHSILLQHYKPLMIFIHISTTRYSLILVPHTCVSALHLAQLPYFRVIKRIFVNKRILFFCHKRSLLGAFHAYMNFDLGVKQIDACARLLMPPMCYVAMVFAHSLPLSLDLSSTANGSGNGDVEASRRSMYSFQIEVPQLATPFCLRDVVVASALGLAYSCIYTCNYF